MAAQLTEANPSFFANRVWIAGALVLGLILRLLDIPGNVFHGDEFASINDAGEFGRTLNGILFFALLRGWLMVGEGEVWIRLLPVLLTLSSIPLAAWAAKPLGGTWTVRAAAFLAAAMPFAVETGTYVRAYALLIPVGFFALGSVACLLENPRSRGAIVATLVALILLPLSHVLGAFASLLLVAVLFVRFGPWPSGVVVRGVLVGVGAGVLFALALVPAVQSLGWDLVNRLIGAFSGSEFTGSRGLGLAQIVKLPITFYVFAVGRHVYPLDFWIVIPAAVVIGLVTLLGLWRSRGSGRALLLVWLGLVFFLILGLDSLAPPNTETMAPKHLTVAFPAFVLLLAVGLGESRQRFLTAATGVILAIGVGFSLLGDWSYGVRMDRDWKAGLRLLEGASANAAGTTETRAGPLLLHDGRSTGFLDFYGPQDLEKRFLGSPEEVAEAIADRDTLFVVTYDHQEARRAGFNAALQEISDDFIQVAGFVDYPLFVSRWVRSVPEDVHGYLFFPGDVYSIALADLDLPNRGDRILRLGDVEGEWRDEVTWSFPELRTLDDRTMASINMGFLSFNALVYGEKPRLAPGESLAMVEFTLADGSTRTEPIIWGEDIGFWDGSEGEQALAEDGVAFRKRVALVGQTAYPGAYRDFRARFQYLWHGRFTEAFTSIRIRFLADRGTLAILGPVTLQQEQTGTVRQLPETPVVDE